MGRWRKGGEKDRGIGRGWFRQGGVWIATVVVLGKGEKFR